MENSATYITVQTPPADSNDELLLSLLEVKYRSMLMELRSVERYLIANGRISQSALRPVRGR